MKLLLSLITVLILNPIFSQIPNSSFEDWYIENTLEVPLNWSTNNFNNGFVSVTKVESLTNGAHAMKVESKGLSFEGFAPGFAKTTFLPIQNIKNLELSYKIDSIEAGGNIEIIVSQLEGGEFQQLGYWTTNQKTSGIGYLQIPFNLINSDSLKIEIFANNHLTPTGYEGHAEIIVDELRMNLTSSTIKSSLKEEMIITPNPSTGIFILQLPNLLKEANVVVINTNGYIVLQKSLKNNILDEIDISTLPAGQYNVAIYSEKDLIKYRLKKIIKIE